MEFIQRNERIAVLGTLRILAAIVKNSYKRVKFGTNLRMKILRFIRTGNHIVSCRLKQFIINWV
jgi:hypothetical protein